MSSSLLLALAFLAIAATPAAADQDPLGCTSGDPQLAVTADRTAARPGEVINFAVSASNTAAQACTVTGATVTLRLPGATGAATGELRTLTANGVYVAGASGIAVGAVIPRPSRSRGRPRPSPRRG